MRRLLISTRLHLVPELEEVHPKNHEAKMRLTTEHPAKNQSCPKFCDNDEGKLQTRQ
jgi:hypothetical protein